MDRNVRELSSIGRSFNGRNLSSIVSLCGYDHSGVCPGGVSISLCGGSGLPSLAIGVTHLGDDPVLDEFFSENVCVDLNFTSGRVSQFPSDPTWGSIETPFVVVYGSCGWHRLGLWVSSVHGAAVASRIARSAHNFSYH